MLERPEPAVTPFAQYYENSSRLDVVTRYSSSHSLDERSLRRKLDGLLAFFETAAEINRQARDASFSYTGIVQGHSNIAFVHSRAQK